MGIEVAIALAIASVAVGAYTAKKQISLAKKSANADKRANQIQGNREQFETSQSVRRRVRLRRIEAAKLSQSAENTGTSASSAEGGVLSSAASTFGSNRSNATGANQASKQISLQKQISADLKLESEIKGAKNDVFQSATKSASPFFT